MSLLTPHEGVRDVVKLVLERRLNQVDGAVGRYTVRSDLPSPSKSLPLVRLAAMETRGPVCATVIAFTISPASAGMSPGNPHWVKVLEPYVPLLDVKTNQSPSQGRQTARSALLSPSKSPGAGMSPDSPPLHRLGQPPVVVRARLQDVPDAVRRSPHRDVGLSITVVVHRHRDVARRPPLNGESVEKGGRRLGDEPHPGRRSKHGEIRRAITVEISRHRDVAGLSKHYSLAADVPFARNQRRPDAPSVGGRSRDQPCRRRRSRQATGCRRSRPANMLRSPWWPGSGDTRCRSRAATQPHRRDRRWRSCLPTEHLLANPTAM